MLEGVCGVGAGVKCGVFWATASSSGMAWGVVKGELSAKVITPQKVNQCFEVRVVSGARDGGAPELNPGWVHRRMNTCLEARQALNYFQVDLH